MQKVLKLMLCRHTVIYTGFNNRHDYVTVIMNTFSPLARIEKLPYLTPWDVFYTTLRDGFPLVPHLGLLK